MVNEPKNWWGVIQRSAGFVSEKIQWKTHTILEPKLGELNERLCLWNKSTSRLLGMLRREWFEKKNISSIQSFTHLVWNSWDFQWKQALHVSSIDKFIRFGYHYVVDNISAQLIDDNGLKFLWFIVEIEWKSYIYNLLETGDTEMFGEQEYSEEEARDVIERNHINRTLQWKDIEKQLKTLKWIGFQSFQRSSILELEHYMRRNNRWNLDTILYDNIHKVLLQFGDDFIADEISVNRSSDNRGINGLIIKREERYFYYILWKQYRETFKPIIRENPSSQDWAFESEEMLLAYIEYFYNKWNITRN